MFPIFVYLFSLFNSVVSFRAGPSAMPVSQPLLLISGAVYIALGFATAQVLGKAPSTAVLAAFVDCLFYISWFGGIVSAFGNKERILQTLLCVLLIGWLAGGFGLALAWPIANSTPETVSGTVLILGLLSIVWVITLLGRCLAEAIEKPTSFGVGLTIAYLVTNDLLLRVFA
ncbi:MAG: hypothetical protein ACI91G_000885 [Gammaproteobacteria bacterium]